MEIETVYYRLWDKDTFNKGVEFANSGVSDGYSIIFDDDSLNRKIYSLRDMQAPNFSKSDFDFALECTDIRTNNVAFIDILQDKIQDGYQACKDWLCGLMEDYSQRCGGNRLQDCKDWLKTTRLICDNPNIVEMCKDIENGLKVPYDGNEEFEEFRVKVGFLLSKDEAESLYRALRTMRPKATKTYYEENPKIKQYFTFKAFFENCVEFGHHEGERSWTYDNARKR